MILNNKIWYHACILVASRLLHIYLRQGTHRCINNVSQYKCFSNLCKYVIITHYVTYMSAADGKTCGSPPSVPNAKASPAGPLPVGHTHNYTCNVHYTPLRESYTTCQENGKWSNVVFRCQGGEIYYGYTCSAGMLMLLF